MYEHHSPANRISQLEVVPAPARRHPGGRGFCAYEPTRDSEARYGRLVETARPSPPATARSSLPRRRWNNSAATRNGSPAPAMPSPATGGNATTRKQQARGRALKQTIQRIGWTHHKSVSCLAGMNPDFLTDGSATFASMRSTKLMPTRLNLLAAGSRRQFPVRFCFTLLRQRCGVVLMLLSVSVISVVSIFCFPGCVADSFNDTTILSGALLLNCELSDRTLANIEQNRCCRRHLTQKHADFTRGDLAGFQFRHRFSFNVCKVKNSLIIFITGAGAMAIPGKPDT